MNPKMFMILKLLIDILFKFIIGDAEFILFNIFFVGLL